VQGQPQAQALEQKKSVMFDSTQNDKKSDLGHTWECTCIPVSIKKE
jgi:hypothetical protein